MKAPKSAIRVVLSRDCFHLCAISLTETAVRMMSRAKLPRPKSSQTSRCPALTPTLPAALPTSVPALPDGDSRLISCSQWKR